MIEIGSNVKVTNRQSDWYGETGMVTSIDTVGPFMIVEVQINPGIRVVTLSENDIEETK